MAELDIGIGGLGPRTTTRRSESARITPADRSALFPPPPPVRDFVPDDDVIFALVARARAALAKGIYWDRGSIINLIL